METLQTRRQVKKVPGVAGVVAGGERYQVVIGTGVGNVFRELLKLGIPSGDADDGEGAGEDMQDRKTGPHVCFRNNLGLYDSDDPCAYRCRYHLGDIIPADGNGCLADGGCDLPGLRYHRGQCILFYAVSARGECGPQV